MFFFTKDSLFLVFTRTTICLLMADVFQQHRQRRCCANKVRLECERVFSARVSDLKWTSVWSGNLLSSEVISLTHSIVKWWGGPSSKNVVTWPRFVSQCVLSSVLAKVICAIFYVRFIALTPYFKLTIKFLTLIFAVLLPTFTLYYKFRSRDLNAPHFGVKLSYDGQYMLYQIRSFYL